MSSVTVSHVPNSVSAAKVQEFFAFCGLIEAVEPLGSQAEGFSAYRVIFTLAKALSTALLLNEAELDNVEISVTEDALPPYPGSSGPSGSSGLEKDNKVQHDSIATGDTSYDDVPQEDKPKLAIFAQLLASGYQLSDKVIDKAVNIDQRNGISTKFKNFLTNLDSKYFHTDDPQSTSSQGIGKAQSLLNSFSKSLLGLKYLQALQGYFDKASASPYGAKVHSFYKQVSKEVRDVHEEAKRLNELRAAPSATQSGTTQTTSAAQTTSATGADYSAAQSTGAAGADYSAAQSTGATGADYSAAQTTSATGANAAIDTAASDAHKA